MTWRFFRVGVSNIFFQTKFLKISTFNVIKNYDAIDENQPVIINQSFHFIRRFPTRFFTNQKKITENGKPWIENYTLGREAGRSHKNGIQDYGWHLSRELGILKLLAANRNFRAGN